MRLVSIHVRSMTAQVFVVGVGAALLSSCGADNAPGSQASDSSASHTVSTEVTVAAQDQGLADALRPAFHVAPVITEEPEDIDVADPSASSKSAPRRQSVPAELAMLSTRRLTRRIMDDVRETGMVPSGSVATPDGTLTPATAAVYTPAQIRAAYQEPVLPATSAVLTPAQAAQFGAGQTIYLIDAMGDPNAAAELATFDSKFGLPACQTTAIAASAVLPLSAATTTGCSFSVVYTTGAGKMTTTAPAYDSGWSTEIALDVQWAHATAPYARIVLIEAPDASLNSLVAAVGLANSMGPGIVSQSFGGPEGSWTSSVDAVYQARGMTYVAAAGDSGYAVNWPAVSANVLAVGGTSLAYSGTGARAETVWSGTGGGISAYVTTPGYQTDSVPGLASPANRAVTDVSFNADPYTGQYVVQILQGSTTATWLTIGGTSLATPQWAGVLAVGNAMRALNGGAVVGLPQPLLYALGEQAGSYSGAFTDVTQGSDGSCTTCYAAAGYDLPTGLGTPNVASLLASINVPLPPAPTVAAGAVSGKVGTSLTFSVIAACPDAVTYSLITSPAGMTINATTGLVTWPAPIAGTYAVVVMALDQKTQESGRGTITATIAVPAPPVVTSGAVSGTAQSALTFTAQVSDSNAVSYSLSGQPAGMLVSTAGVVTWAAPVAGTYPVTVIATDKINGLQGRGVWTVTIAPLTPPTVAAAAVSGYSGTALSFVVRTTATNPLTYALAGAPAGMVISSTGGVSWSNPITGTYPVVVTVTDTKTHLTGKGTITVTILKSGPSITSAAVTGTKGVALSFTVSVSDSTSGAVALSVSGLPGGMSVATSGNTLTIKWAKPVAGKYSITIAAKDAQGLTASSVVTITIAA